MQAASGNQSATLISDPPKTEAIFLWMPPNANRVRTEKIQKAVVKEFAAKTEKQTRKPKTRKKAA